MKISVDIVETLFRNCIKKTGKTPDRIGLIEVSEIINASLPDRNKQIGKRYLYDTIFLGIQQARERGEEMLNLDRSVLDSLASFLGINDLDEYRKIHQPLIPITAQAIEGNWYSIVRCNSGKPRVLVSPVKIEVNHNFTLFELRGPHRSYQGKIRWTAGSFDCFITSKDDVKAIHLAFRLGVAKWPKVLSGVFSSISSSGIPVAGKEILLRSEKPYSEMTNHKISLTDNAKAEDSFIRAEILEFFSDFNSSYIKINDTSTFDLDDLL